ncbi:MAG: tRNA preQ1(34) S-adenosylmethionine ribosyltransferase-isomerase QueA [Treponema sp.]|jgi:S-adenosylmethionine:tRNA ribosyltransferase-isomerase|nr:tRNA preQ1(34) S-adenosylmethionine ribosyltransferase-isomerase QueA [Treponema sp.]
MRTADFSFKLPDRLIAQEPPAERGQSRLMTLDRASGVRGHHTVSELPQLLERGSLLVLNDTRVRKARLPATAIATGAQVDFLLVKQLDEHTWQTLVQRARRRRMGSRYVFAASREAEITGEDGEFRVLRFDEAIDEAWLDRHGRIPLPPYIKRADTESDRERYQTIYAKHTGSAAAPTAGLHFTPELLAALAERGVETAFITLHVGLGTFLPVRTATIEAHTMHEEVFSIDEATARKVMRAKREGRKVVAVGTTSVRALESAWNGDGLSCGAGATSIFIYPGYVFNVIDALFTNFHTPESTLLMLVSAFAGRDCILESYREAVAREYRFFSYGDAMLIT